MIKISFYIVYFNIFLNILKLIKKFYFLLHNKKCKKFIYKNIKF